MATIFVRRSTDVGAHEVSDEFPLPVELFGGLPPSETHVGIVTGQATIISPTIYVDTSAYTAGDVVGSSSAALGNGVLTLLNAVRVEGGTARLASLLVVDHAAQKAGFEVLLFDSVPASTFTDQSACPTLARLTDNARLLRRVSVTPTDYITIGSTAIADLTFDNLLLKAASPQRNLYAVLVTTSTPTYATNAVELYVKFGLIQD